VFRRSPEWALLQPLLLLVRHHCALRALNLANHTRFFNMLSGKRTALDERALPT
jgi:hypothetical protein